MKNIYLILLISTFFINCKSVDNNSDATYFSGQIINPKNNFITLMKGDKALDTIYLSKNNTFSTQLDYIKEGLYSFKHGPEHQYIYFEPKDSIVIRLNTWDFDESLVFSGKGAEKNNFLITLYLQNEKERKSFQPYYNLKPDEFLNKISTSEALNNYIYEQLKNSGVKLTEKFEKLAKVTVSYPIYLRKEIYPYRHKNRFQLDSLPKLPSNYFDYKKNININNKDLIDYAPYHNYVNNYLYNLAYEECNEKENATANVLNIITKNINVKEFKNRLLFQAIYSDFRRSKNSCCIDNNSLKVFNKHCTDTELLNRINYLDEDCKINLDGTIINDFDLITKNNIKVKLKTIIRNKKVVIYFWSEDIMSSEILTRRIQSLKKKFPSLKFIGINMKGKKHCKITNNTLPNQYYLPQNSSGRKLIKSKEPRTILVDKNGIVTTSFTYLSSPFLNKQLLDLEKK